MKTSIVHGVEIKHETMPLFWEQASTGQWEPFTFECIKQHVKPGSVFLDIGSWNGVFSVYADKLGAKTHAFEPDPVALKETLGLIQLNKCGTNLWEYAVSKKDGFLELNNMGAGFGNSESSLINRGHIGVKTTVSTINLVNWLHAQSFTWEDISLIKMDVEGGEIDILTDEKTKNFIETYTPTIHISFHPGWLDFDKDIDSVLYLFDSYNAISDMGSQATSRNFKEILKRTPHEHAFLFTAKC